MRFVHPSHPGRCVRLAYCLNVHPAQDLAAFERSLELITLSLRQRVADGREFGVGMYLPANLASELRSDERALERLRAKLEREGLDAFTYNAFPFAGFGESGLKRRVFEPTWWERERAQFTLDIAHIADRLRPEPGVLSISTHTGAHSAALGGRTRERALADCASAWRELDAQLAGDRLARVFVALEPEPDALIGSMAELEAARASLSAGVRSIGACLDACHSAVLFEDPEASVERALEFGAGLVKLQFTSALALPEPTSRAAGREALFALDEPRYLHQLAALGRDGAVTLREDLGAARRAFENGDAELREASEWRCHFHVPVDLAELAELGLEVTSRYADELLERALARPERWLRGELHLELETYTWSVLPDAARGPGALVDGLEREYRHVIDLLARAGWRAG